jgi:hypothetical protein
MNTHSHIIDQIGAETIAQALGVARNAVFNAKARKSFPASWFPVLRQLCESRQVDCPENLFNFKIPSDGAPMLGAAAEGSCLSRDCAGDDLGRQGQDPNTFTGAA